MKKSLFLCKPIDRLSTRTVAVRCMQDGHGRQPRQTNRRSVPTGCIGSISRVCAPLSVIRRQIYLICHARSTQFAPFQHLLSTVKICGLFFFGSTSVRRFTMSKVSGDTLGIAQLSLFAIFQTLNYCLCGPILARSISALRLALNDYLMLPAWV